MQGEALDDARGKNSSLSEMPIEALETLDVRSEGGSLSEWKFWERRRDPRRRRSTPKPTPAPSRPCQDLADFKDKDGHTCHDYRHSLHACTGSGTIGGEPMNGGGGWETSTFRKYKNSQGISADMACCACGGGDRGSCTDTPDWVDRDGHDCAFYTDPLHACTGYGPRTPEWDFWMFKRYAAEGSTGADFACCGCGGGNRDMVCTDKLVDGKPWRSKDGDNCAAHEWDHKYKMCTGNGLNPQLFKPSYFRDQDTRSPKGYGALEVCCVCGGGDRLYK